MAYRVLARRSSVISDHLSGRHVLALRNMDRARSTNFLGTCVFSTNCHDKEDKFIAVSPPKEDLGISALKIFRSSYHKEKLDSLKEKFSYKVEGAKLLKAALSINTRLLGKVSRGTSLSRRERMQLIRTTAEMFITVPVATRVVLPVLNCVSPLLLKLFPNMLSTSIIRKMKEQEATKRKERQQQTREELFWLAAVVAIFAMSLMEFLLPKMVPPTFGDKIKEQETMRRKLKAKLEYVRFLQDTTREMVRQILSSRNGDIKQTAEELDEFIDKVKRGATVSLKETMDFAKLFNNEVILDNISRSRLVNICKYLGITAHGADAYLRFMVQERLKRLQEDDILIVVLGVESLSEAQLREDCTERGMIESYSVEDMRLQLSDWLNLSVTHSIPSAILILSRPFAVTRRLKCKEIVLATLCSLPQEVVNSLSTSLPFKDRVKQRRRKLQHLEMQDELIKEEQTKLRNLSKVEQSDATEDDVALKEMSIPTTKETQEQVNVIPKVINIPAAKVAEQETVVAVKSQICKLGRSFATSILASASTVSKEREEFLRLVNRKINFYNYESSDGEREAAADGETGSGKPYKAAAEENDKEDTEVNVRDAAPSRLLDSVNKMLLSLEKQLDDVDSKIRNNWQDLDRYYDGRFSQEEVADAAMYLEDTLDNGNIQGLVKDLSKDKVYELRLSCCYSQKEGKLQLNNLTMHGTWPAHIVDGTVVHILNTEKEIAHNMPIAKKLLKQLGKDYPDIRSKMDTHWISIDHTLDSETLWQREICKHGSMDYTYWIKAIEMASQFFYDDGKCKLIDMIKEEGYIEGKFNSEKFQDDMSRRVGKRVLTTYRRKISKKIYFMEIGILFDDSNNMLNYPKTKLDFDEFVIERHESEDSFKTRLWKLFKNIKLWTEKHQHVPVETAARDTGDDI